MLPVNFAFLLTLWLSAFYLVHADSRKLSSDVNQTLCEYPCHPLAPPPPPPSLPDNPSYGTPPPPYPIYGYPPYGTPPSQINCTQFPQLCCFQPPPYPLGYQPYESYATVCSPFHFILVGSLVFSISVLL
ncbi:hypothetical protein MANES_03G141250v8 [Manihot esculenta]|uniref:Uncharacterized protein n=1 Tax=Manihot esculenta TaxID=3983 RepID=A0ACB7I5N4_MANES|nr:hypothetical protein MANES_03G141250v8 [Manihot esculenta]